VSKPAGTFRTGETSLLANMAVTGDGSPAKGPVPPALVSMYATAVLVKLTPRFGPGPDPLPPVPPL